MPITPAAFVNSRCYAFHVCGAVNFKLIRSSRMLRSTESILLGTAHDNLLQGKRNETLSLDINGDTVQIRDHKPLIFSSIELVDGYSLNDFLRELNSRVFLWSGTKTGPCDSGKNHINKYSTEGRVYILRIPTSRLLEVNAPQNLEVTFCNSGSGRQNLGNKAKRGRSTFMKLEVTTRKPGEVVELTFRKMAHLPEETEYAEDLSGPWLPLNGDV